MPSPKTIPRASKFIKWAVKQIREHKWSFDSCVGRAKESNLFQVEKIPCTKTLYNLLWNGELPISLFELPEVLGRRQHGKPRIPKRSSGKSIDQRPGEVEGCNTFGHWDSDTVLGKKKKGEPAVFSIMERLTGCYLTIRAESKTTQGVAKAMGELRAQYGKRYSLIFRSITTDNGSEFADFACLEALGTTVYFAHPCSSWERPINERSNRLLRRCLPKGKSVSGYTEEEILSFADEINSMPRKRLGYRTPEELFEEH